jgi:competence protein ComGC
MVSLLFASWFALGSWFGFGLYGTLLLEPDWQQATPAGDVRHSDAALFLPETTLAYVSLVDPSSLDHHLAQTQLWKLALSGPFQKEMQDLASELRKALQSDDSLRLPYDELRPVFTGPMALALLDFEPEKAKDGQPLHLAFLAELAPGSEDKVKPLVQDKVFVALKEPNKLRFEDVPGGAWPYTRIVADGKPVAAFAAQNGRFLMVTHEQDLATLTQHAAHPLAQSAEFQKHQARFQAADVAAYLDIARLQLRVLPALGPGEAESVRAMVRIGLGELHSATYSAAPEREGYLEHFELGYQPDGQGLLARRLTASSASAIRSIQQAPASTSLFLALHIGPVGPLYQDILKLVEKERPDNLAEWRQTLAEAREKTGVDFEKDVIEQLSGELGIALKLPSISGSILDNPMIGLGYLSDAYFSVFVGVNDEKKADEVVRKLLAKAELTVTSEPYRGVSVGYLSSSSPLPVIPAYSVLDGLVGFHLNAGTAKACIDSKLDGKGLRQDADWQAASQGLDADPSSGLLYLRLSEFVPLAARLGKRDLEMGAGSATPEAETSRRIAALGEAETLGKKLRGIYARSSGSPGASVRDSYSPMAMGAGLSLMNLAALFPALLVPSLLEPRVSVEETQAIAFLREVHTAQMAYQMDHMAYAGSLQDLVQAGGLSAEASAGPAFEAHLETSAKGYSLALRPVRYQSGARSFFVAEDGVVRGSDNGGAWGDASMPAIP